MQKGYDASTQWVVIPVVADSGTNFSNLNVWTSMSAKIRTFAQKMAPVRILKVRMSPEST